MITKEKMSSFVGNKFDMSVIKLTEEDVSGASLAGRLLSQLKIEELKFRLLFRGDSCKGLKTKVEFVKR